MEDYQIVLMVVIGLLILFFIIFKMIPSKKKNKNWSIIERIPVGDEKGGWYARNKFTGQTTKLYTTKKELFQNAK